MAFFSLIAQAVVGVGTLLISLVALYQSRLSLGERHKRDIAEHVYTPLRKEVVGWLDPENQSVSVWKELQEKEFYWTKRVPDEMVTLLDEAERVYSKLVASRVLVDKLISAGVIGLTAELRAKANVSAQEGAVQSPPFIRLMSGQQVFGQIFFLSLWVTRMNLTDYLNHRVRKNFLIPIWEVDILIDGRVAYGGLKEAEEYTTQMKAFLEKQAPARDLLEHIDKLRAIGPKVLILIDQETS